MKGRVIKSIYFATLGRFTLFNYYWKKARLRLPPDQRIVLHLGCGAHYIDLPGFVNIDANLFRRNDLWLDITLGLPFPGESIDVVFASHLLEHFPEGTLRKVLREIHRVLKPTGGVRFITPHLRKALQAYWAEDARFFSDWPDAHVSFGGKLNNYLLCRNQHRLMFDFGYFQELLEEAGFTHCEEMSPAESHFFSPAELERIQWEKAETHRSLFVEAFKDPAPIGRERSSSG
jgi:predicted SAM-dependent methyltransferase